MRHLDAFISPPIIGAFERSFAMTASIATMLRRAALFLTATSSFSSLVVNQALAFSTEAQQMCTSDAFRLCASDIPDIPKITACMVKHRADLSAPCRAVMDRDAAQKRAVAEQ
jgi:hypothetical protein